MISRDFVNWIAGIRPRPVVKQHRTAKPGTIGAMTAKQFDELVGGVFSKAIQTTQAKPLASAKTQPESIPLRSALKARAYVQFKTVGIPPVEHAEALKMLLNMTPAERQKLMDQLAAIEQAALDWNMTAGDVIDLIKG